MKKSHKLRLVSSWWHRWFDTWIVDRPFEKKKRHAKWNSTKPKILFAIGMKIGQWKLKLSSVPETLKACVMPHPQFGGDTSAFGVGPPITSCGSPWKQKEDSGSGSCEVFLKFWKPVVPLPYPQFGSNFNTPAFGAFWSRVTHNIEGEWFSQFCHSIV